MRGDDCNNTFVLFDLAEGRIGLNSGVAGNHHDLDVVLIIGMLPSYTIIAIDRYNRNFFGRAHFLLPSQARVVC